MSASYGRVEDFEVITSVVSVVEPHDESTAKDKLTHAPMRQDSYKFIVVILYETAIVENDWKERPVGPRRRTSMLISSLVLNPPTNKEPPIDALCVGLVETKSISRKKSATH